MAKQIYSEDGNSAICDVTDEVYYKNQAEGKFLNKSLLLTKKMSASEIIQNNEDISKTM